MDWDEEKRRLLKKMKEAETTEERKELRKKIDDLTRQVEIGFWKNHAPFTDPRKIPDLPAAISKEDWEEVYRPNLIRCGAIPKDQLEVGKVYIGSCRNASKAKWNGNEFEYERYKWGTYYNDSVPHFDDAWNSSEDVFIPIAVENETDTEKS